MPLLLLASCFAAGSALLAPVWAQAQNATPAAVQAAVQAAVDSLARAAAVPDDENPSLIVLAPRATPAATSRAHVNIAGRTNPGNKAFVGDQEVAVASTGVFVRDKVALAIGMNPVELRVLAPSGASRNTVLQISREAPPDATNAASPSPANAAEPPLVNWPATQAFIVGEGGADLTWGLHQVRLGGPNLAELPPGTQVAVDGQRGDFLRVRLTTDLEAWTPARSLVATGSTATASGFTLGNMMLAGDTAPGGGDVLSIPWKPKVPYAVRVLRGPEGKPVIELEFFGGHLATTWITHRFNPQVVEVVNVEQTQRERPVVRLSLRGKTLWGYAVKPAGDQLQVTVRPAPVLIPTPAQPLHGLHVVLEAGHGGPTNLGAVGITGAPEKDVNLAVTSLLKLELEAAGARVSMVREAEENPTPTQRARLAAATNAHLFVSVHANAAETADGFLRAKGASMLYKHEHSRLLASAIHSRFLQATGLPDYGLIGNFNYTPTRLNTAMPAALIELAFMSNPHEEAQLLDPAVRARMAKAIRDGIRDFVCQSTGTACAGL